MTTPDGEAGGPGPAFRRVLRERARRAHRRIVFPEGTDPRTCAAVREIRRERLMEPVLLGPGAQVAQRLADAGVDPAAVRVVDPTDGDSAERAG